MPGPRATAPPRPSRRQADGGGEFAGGDVDQMSAAELKALREQIKEHKRSVREGRKIASAAIGEALQAEDQRMKAAATRTTQAISQAAAKHQKDVSAAGRSRWARSVGRSRGPRGASAAP